MKKIAVTAAVILLLVVLAALFRPWNVFLRPVEMLVRTTIAVLEGEVEFYEIDRRQRVEFKGVLRRGDIVTLESKQIRPGAGGLPDFSLLRPLIPLAVKVYKEKMEEIVRSKGTRRWEKLYTEEEFDDYITPELQRKTLLSNVYVGLGENGFTGSAKVGWGPLKLDISGNGILTVRKKTGLLDLTIHEIKFGPVKLPRFVRAQLEKAFEEAFEHEEVPLRIVEMEYGAGTLRIVFDKR